MKVLCMITAWVILLLCGGDLQAGAPDFAFGGTLTSGGTPIDLTTPVATVVDWNNDGMKDLLVGDFYNGNIYLYLNEGSDLNPVFNGSTKVESNGSPITTTYG